MSVFEIKDVSYSYDKSKKILTAVNILSLSFCNVQFLLSLELIYYNALASYEALMPYLCPIYRWCLEKYQ